ncbi:hypothetical protein M885DRAFT_558119 [Pelagophyceae sp. CCMP2097]|nr:hypothetical protein M885DRAFT_558119 [Pelagophyceae sp. CCMP2097]
MGCGHAAVALSSTLLSLQWLWATQPKGWVLRFMDREPAAFVSCLLGATGVAMPLIIVPIRRKLGYSTSQYDGFVPDEEPEPNQ